MTDNARLQDDGRSLAWATALALLTMAIIAPLALYGVLGTIGMFTFIGEAVLIGWVFWRAVKGFAPESSDATEAVAEPAAIQAAPVAS